MRGPGPFDILDQAATVYLNDGYEEGRSATPLPGHRRLRRRAQKPAHSHALRSLRLVPMNECHPHLLLTASAACRSGRTYIKPNSYFLNLTSESYTCTDGSSMARRARLVQRPLFL
jgi:hypothetical protein